MDKIIKIKHEIEHLEKISITMKHLFFFYDKENTK